MSGDRAMPGAECSGARWSYAEHIFRDKDDDVVAIRHASEVRPRAGGCWSWRAAAVGRRRDRRRVAGVGGGRGDRAAAYLPNIPETVAAFLACASIGAVWSSAAPEFGARSVVDRSRRSSPRCCWPSTGTGTAARTTTAQGGGADSAGDPFARTGGPLRLPGRRRAGRTGSWSPPRSSSRRCRSNIRCGCSTARARPGCRSRSSTARAGSCSSTLKKLHLHLDAQAGDRLFWFSTTGWMMWNFLVGVLLTDASIVLFDGNPGYPDLGTLWDLADRTRMTHASGRARRSSRRA